MKAELKVIRFLFTEKSTISEFYLNGTLFGYVLEDKDRGLDNSMTEEQIKKIKKFGETAIPTGVYEVKLFNSPSHGIVPQLEDVKGYTYIQIHVGNFPKDSLGCLLLGSSYGTDAVKNSKATVKKLVQELEKYDDIIISIFRK